MILWLLLSLFFSCRGSLCEDGLCVFLFTVWVTNMIVYPLFVHLFNSFTYSPCVDLCEFFNVFS